MLWGRQRFHQRPLAGEACVPKQYRQMRLNRPLFLGGKELQLSADKPGIARAHRTRTPLQDDAGRLPGTTGELRLRADGPQVRVDQRSGPRLPGRAWYGLALAGILTACTTLPAVHVACPPLRNYTLAQQQALALALKDVPADSPIVGFITDYGQLRSEVRACASSAP